MREVNPPCIPAEGQHCKRRRQYTRFALAPAVVPTHTKTPEKPCSQLKASLSRDCAGRCAKNMADKGNPSGFAIRSITGHLDAGTVKENFAMRAFAPPSCHGLPAIDPGTAAARHVSTKCLVRCQKDIRENVFFAWSASRLDSIPSSCGATPKKRSPVSWHTNGILSNPDPGRCRPQAVLSARQDRVHHGQFVCRRRSENARRI